MRKQDRPKTQHIQIYRICIYIYICVCVYVCVYLYDIKAYTWWSLKCCACLFLNCWNEESGIKFHTKCNVSRTDSTCRSSRSSNTSNKSDSRSPALAVLLAVVLLAPEDEEEEEEYPRYPLQKIYKPIESGKRAGRLESVTPFALWRIPCAHILFLVLPHPSG